jgi:hypothetical protein
MMIASSFWYDYHSLCHPETHDRKGIMPTWNKKIVIALPLGYGPLFGSRPRIDQIQINLATGEYELQGLVNHLKLPHGSDSTLVVQVLYLQPLAFNTATGELIDSDDWTAELQTDGSLRVYRPLVSDYGLYANTERVLRNLEEGRSDLGIYENNVPHHDTSSLHPWNDWPE